MSAVADQVRELVEIRRQIKELRDQERELEINLADSMESKQLIVKGVGMVIRRERSARTRWRSEEVLDALGTYVDTAQRFFDPKTGQVESERETAFRILSDCARMEWRSTSLRKYGLDADEYCSKERAGYAIVIEEGITDGDE